MATNFTLMQIFLTLFYQSDTRLPIVQLGMPVTIDTSPKHTHSKAPVAPVVLE